MPLKELFTVIILIWAGSFLCMIPSLLEEVEHNRRETEIAEATAYNKYVAANVGRSRQEAKE